MSSCLVPYQKLASPDKLLIIFCQVDDLARALPVCLGSSRGRKGSLSTIEIITLIAFFYEMGFSDWKHYFTFLRSYHSHDFNLPEYKNFVVQINEHMKTAIQILHKLTEANKRSAKIPVSIADSSKLPVCTNKRIFTHKVCKGVATRGVSSCGYFFGFKLHLITDLEGNLQSVRITQANVDDRTPLVRMAQGLRCLLLLADAGYVSKPLTRFFWQMGIWYLTCIRVNMKKLITWWQHELLKKRQRVEVVLSVLKYRMGMVSSLPRSVRGHLARYVHTCLAYQLKRMLKSNCYALSYNLIS